MPRFAMPRFAMPGTCPAKIDCAAIRSHSAPILTVLLAVLLAGCGSDRAEEELMRRVIAAEAAAASADAARVQAEQAVANLGTAEFAEEAEFSSDIEGSGEEEEMAEIAPDDQDSNNEIVAPPAPDPAPQGRMPA